MGEFWNGVKQVLKGAAKVTISYAVIKFVEDQLNKQIRNQIISNLIKLVVFLAAIFISGLSPFGKNVSMFISSVIMTGLLVHSFICLIPKVIKTVKTMKKYKIIPLIPLIFDGVSLTEITAYWISSWGPLASALKEKFGSIIAEWIPTADELYDAIKKYAGLRFCVFIVTLALYFVLFTFAAKPILQLAAMRVAGLKVYLLPFSMAIDFLFKTDITQWITG